MFDGKRQVGHFRVQYGHFNAHANDAGGPVVYESVILGDDQLLPEECGKHLALACAAIRTWHALQQKKQGQTKETER